MRGTDNVALEQGQINKEDYLDLPYGQRLEWSEDGEGPSKATTVKGQAKNARENAKNRSKTVMSDMLTYILNTIQYNNERLDDLMWTIQQNESMEDIQSENKEAVEQSAKSTGKRLDDILIKVNKRVDDLSNNAENMS